MELCIGEMIRLREKCLGIGGPTHSRIIRPKMRIVSKLVGQIVRGDGRIETWEDVNLTSDNGDLYYAKLLAGEAGGETFNTLVFGTAGTFSKSSNFSAMTEVDSPNSRKALTSKETNNGDAANTGKGVDVVTYKFVYSAGDFTGSSIIKAVITNPTPAASENCLMLATITTFDIGASDSLTFWVNHEMAGAT